MLSITKPEKDSPALCEIIKGELKGEKIYINKDKKAEIDAYEDPDYIIENVLFKDPEYLKLTSKIKLSTKKMIDDALLSDDRVEFGDVGTSELYKKILKLLDKIYRTEIYLKNGEIRPLINENVHNSFFVSGPSGSGKSFYIGQLLKQMRDSNPDIPIYVVSKVEEDPAYDFLNAKVPEDLQMLIDKKKIERVKDKITGNIVERVIMPTEEQIKKYEELTEHNIIRIATKGKEGYEAWVGLTGDKKTNVPQMKIEMLKDSVIVFDDCNTILDKDINTGIRKFMDDCLETSRHWNLTLFATTHLIQDYLFTRKLLSECSQITLFPSGNWPSVSKFLKNNAGMGQAMIDKIKWIGENSRWITYNRSSFPPYIIYASGVLLLN